MKLVAFELSMPCAASWNGKWSGDGRPYVRVRHMAQIQITNLAPVIKPEQITFTEANDK